ncbi:MAG: hypothetical protein LUC44_05275 [Prevotellaceae bacterium]|nr:hypothetical protein [Prevotellaceae bacterium]
MRNATLVFLLSFLLLACTSEVVDQHKVIRERAAACFSCLVKGDIDAYLSSFAGADEMPPEFRSQMEDVFSQYMEELFQSRGGIAGATVVGDTLLDSIRADAFVEITFGDSTTETINLPMILSGGEWMLQ